jgi:hypothetical protein
MRRNLILLATFCLSACDAAKIDACRPGADVICGIVRPEDIELIPGTSWMLVSELGGGDKPGRILLIDPITQERGTLAEGRPAVAEAGGFPRCGPPPDTLRPRGIHLSKGADGAYHLLVVAGARIERYRVDVAAAAVALQWEGCVDVPSEIMANDVAGFADGGFVVSHMYDPPRGQLLDLKMLLGFDTGYAVKWTGAGGWQRMPNTDVSFANGIQIDPATSRVYVSSMFTQRIVAVDPDGGNRSQSARSPIQADNLSWSSDGRLVGAGHTGIPVYGISACRGIGDAPCSFPFAVVAFDPKTLAHETLFEIGTGAIPGASVAVVEKDAIYLAARSGKSH